MHGQQVTSWLLNGQTGWRTGSADAGIAVAGELGIRLAANPQGPLALGGAAESLGQLTLPRGMALSEDGTLYLLETTQPHIKRFDPATSRFVRLPAVGGNGTEARQFRTPTNIAVAGRNLYVADRGNRRVQVFDRRTLTLRHLWEIPGWDPVDVAGWGDLAYILDGGNGRVYRHSVGSDALHSVVHNPNAANRWTRLTIDRSGRIYLLDAQAEPPQLHVYSAKGDFVKMVDDAGDVRDQFDAPPIQLDHKGRFCLPASLQDLCHRQAPEPPVPLEKPLALCPPFAEGGILFDRNGALVSNFDPTEPSGPPPYQKKGVWISESLDSDIYHCQWHRMEMELSALPAGTQVIVSTYTSEERRTSDDIQNLPGYLWETHSAITGRMQPPPAAGAASNSLDPGDLLVQSREGRYLWLRLQLKGDGFGTPAVTAVRIHYPRISYLEHLPAVFAADDESRWFLERYLSIAQTEWDALEQTIADISRYFDPEAVPEGTALEYLASWLALPLEGDWDWQKKRNLLSAAPKLYARRSTQKSVRDYLQIYVQNMRGISPKDQGAYPQIVEGFRERQFLQLSLEKGDVLGYGAPLWGPGMVGRLQLDVFAREGEVRLVSTGDPERDVFHEYAHRFRVFTPAAWVRTAEDERMLCRALDAEKPAHTQYDLCLVEPRMRVGVQSTVGLDTIVGGYPTARLACTEDPNAPPSQAPRHRLGYDMILGGAAPGQRGTEIRPGVRVGVETVVL